MWSRTIQTAKSPRPSGRPSRLAALLLAAAAAVCCLPSFATAHALSDGVEVEIRDDGVAQLFWQGDEALRVEPRGVPAEGKLALEQRHWSYFHLEEIVFWELALPDQSAFSPHTGIRLRSPMPFELVRQRLSIHRSVGGPRQVELQLPLFRIEREGRNPLFATVLRSDARPWSAKAAGLLWTFDDAPTQRVSLALIVGESREILWYNAGQALFAGELGEGAPLSDWLAPPLCARCRTPRLDGASLELRSTGPRHELLLRHRSTDSHSRPSNATLHVAGLPLADALINETQRSAFYLLDEQDPRTALILAELEKPAPELSLQNQAGQALAVKSWKIHLPATEHAAVEGTANDELPHQLSNSLLEAWPNPFAASEGTIIRYTLPATLEEAFDFDDDQSRHFKLSDPPPFGLNPTVNIRVYNVQGQLVRNLLSGVGDAGENELFWDGKDAAQRNVAAGAYFLRMELGEYSVTRRAILLKQ